MNNVAIVIPIYKVELSQLEKISLEQAVKVFKNYDKFYVSPNSLKHNYAVKDIKTVSFNSSWFKDVYAYSALMLTTKFYKAFEEYKYILIYQLDAFVFEDKLLYFCDLGYDYIGAPWLYGTHYFLDSEHIVWYVGNGGFSLRNVSKCIKLIESTYPSMQGDIIEDVFFSIGNSDSFKVAPVEVALEFSFESEVRRCFAMNGNKLPFGCHAWEKFDLPFWKPYIEAYHYKIDENDVAKGNEDTHHEYERWRKESYFWQYGYRKEVLENFLKEKKRKIYIWGTGKIGTLFGKLLRETDIALEGYLDNNKSLVGMHVDEQEVLSIENFERNHKDAFVVIAMNEYKEDVAKQLDIMGCRYEIDYIFYRDIF